MIENKKYFIAPINSSKAFQFVSYWHYSGKGTKKAKLNLGVFRKEDGLLIGVLQWGTSANENINLSKYVKEEINRDEYLELNRFCMADSEGRNSESQAISLGIKWIKQNRPDIRLLISYAGRVEGNYGYIYQATNWEYLGHFVSFGFWLLDGKEHHQIGMWNIYKKQCDQLKPFKEAICELYNSVVQIWSKQFIYIQRLDNKLTPATELLPYPKPDTELQIITRKEVYKDEPFEVVEKVLEEPKFYYDPDELLFTRRTLYRQGALKRQVVAIYDQYGEFEDVASSITDAARKLNITTTSITKALKSGKLSCSYFFRYMDESDTYPDRIEIPWLAEIDGIRFLKQIEIANYCGVSKQAVSQAYKRQSKMINGFEVIWNI